MSGFYMENKWLVSIWNGTLGWNELKTTFVRSNHQRCFIRKADLKNFAIFTVRHVRVSFYHWRIKAAWKTGIPFWRPNSAAQKTIFNFFFQLYFNKKYDEVAINDLTMHLIISKRFRRQKCRQKSKAIRQKEVEAKEQTVYEKVFIHLNTNRSRECSLFLLRK